MAKRSRFQLGQAATMAAALFRIHVLRRRAPLFVSWNITFHCNLHCKYCNTHTIRRKEWDVPQILAGLDTLWGQGVRWITFGGGEPFLKKGLGEILAHAKGLGFNVFLSTNGWLASEHRAELAFVDHANISLDGPREVHDLVRGAGAFDKALEGVDVCREEGVSVSLLCVLSKHNLEHVEEVVRIASERGLTVMFQPATRWLNSSEESNPICPPVEEYRATVARLKTLKKGGAPIRNSLGGLDHIAHWPDPTPIWCVAGRLISVLEPDGSVLTCHQAQVGSFLKTGCAECAEAPLAERFCGAQIPKGCVQCWCAPLVELALLFSLRPSSVLNAFKTLL
jgi:MoaA/NifB/PqqE/SkfB family radical SAM enzyme